MKIRSQFVSNSSSASFTIKKYYLSQFQQEKLLAYQNSFSEYWEIHDDGDVIRGFTIMNNGDMEDFLTKIGISPSVIDDES